MLSQRAAIFLSILKTVGLLLGILYSLNSMIPLLHRPERRTESVKPKTQLLSPVVLTFYFLMRGGFSFITAGLYPAWDVTYYGKGLEWREEGCFSLRFRVFWGNQGNFCFLQKSS